MFPLIWVGAALAAAFLSGCSRKTQESSVDPGPLKPTPPPTPDSRDFIKVPAVSPAPVDPAKPEAAPPKKMDAGELKSLAEELKQILKIQQRYGFSCPPAVELPPGVTCQEVDLTPELDPATPQKVRDLSAPSDQPKSVPNI